MCGSVGDAVPKIFAFVHFSVDKRVGKWYNMDMECRVMQQLEFDFEAVWQDARASAQARGWTEENGWPQHAEEHSGPSTGSSEIQLQADPEEAASAA